MTRIVSFLKAKKWLAALLLVFLLLLLALYLYYFFEIGINYDGVFLEKEIAAQTVSYHGSSLWGDLDISIDRTGEETKVVYNLPNNINKTYIVRFGGSDQYGRGELTIRGAAGYSYFEGYYLKNSPFLFDADGNPLIEGSVIVVSDGGNPYNPSYDIPLSSVASMAESGDEVIRGNPVFLVFAIIVALITVIDIRFPLFFFKMEHMIDVKDPEPSEWYLMVQRFMRYASPAIILILLIAGLVWKPG